MENNVLELMDQEIRRRQRGITQVHVAWVGCCVEVQRMTEPTLSMVPLVQIKSFHINEILENPELLDDDFDLIVHDGVSIRGPGAFGAAAGG